MLPKTSGRIALPLVFSVVRELNSIDLLRLVTETVERSAPPSIQKLTARHHTAARLLASGKSCTEVAILVSRTPQRIRDLQSDPTFSELVSYYHDQIKEESLSDSVRLQHKLVTLAEDALEEIDDRLSNDEKRSAIPISELRQIAAMGLDRTVAPPKTATPVTTPPQQITFNIGQQTIKELPEKITVIDGEVDAKSRE